MKNYLKTSQMPYFCLFVLLTFFGFFATMPVSAQVVKIGECYENSMGKTWEVDSNIWIRNKFNWSEQGKGIVDPSGQTFLRMPSASPYNQFWVDWNMQLIRINAGGWVVVGGCNINPNFVNQFKPQINLVAPKMSVVTLGESGMLGSTETTGNIPTELIDTEQEFLAPGVPTESMLSQCVSTSSGNTNALLDCVAPNMLGKKELAAYECLKSAGNDKSKLSLCLLQSNMGQEERRIFGAAQDCYRQYQSQWNQYPVCMASANYDPKLARAIACLQNSSQGGSINYWGAAACYLGPDLKQRLGLNQEATVAMECAMQSGGNPKFFVACTAGRLTMAELEKCMNVGVGDNGCFGKNNVFRSTIDNVARELGKQFGENNEVVKAWNDITKGPGRNNDAVKTVNNVMRESGKAAENIKREAKKVLPRIKIKW